MEKLTTTTAGKKRSLSAIRNNKDKEKWKINFVVAKVIPLELLIKSPDKHMESQIIAQYQWTSTRGNIKKLFKPESLIVEGIEKKGSAKRFKGSSYYQFDKKNQSTKNTDNNGKRDLTITIPNDKCNNDRVLNGFINILNGFDRTSVKTLRPEEHINCILLADYLRMRIIKEK